MWRKILYWVSNLDVFSTRQWIFFLSTALGIDHFSGEYQIFVPTTPTFCKSKVVRPVGDFFLIYYMSVGISFVQRNNATRSWKLFLEILFLFWSRLFSMMCSFSVREFLLLRHWFDAVSSSTARLLCIRNWKKDGSIENWLLWSLDIMFSIIVYRMIVVAKRCNPLKLTWNFDVPRYL